MKRASEQTGLSIASFKWQRHMTVWVTMTVRGQYASQAPAQKNRDFFNADQYTNVLKNLRRMDPETLKSLAHCDIPE